MDTRPRSTRLSAVERIISSCVFGVQLKILWVSEESIFLSISNSPTIDLRVGSKIENSFNKKLGICLVVTLYPLDLRIFAISTSHIFVEAHISLRLFTSGLVSASTCKKATSLTSTVKKPTLGKAVYCLLRKIRIISIEVDTRLLKRGPKTTFGLMVQNSNCSLSFKVSTKSQAAFSAMVLLFNRTYAVERKIMYDGKANF